MKILNLYAGIGGNRKLWTKENTGLDLEITAVELNPNIAEIYKDFFPDDKVIVADAHQYLLEHYKEFDFIWSSPPCPTHSRINTDGQRDMRYPDMTLYQQIIALGNNWFKGRWVVENVIPYYRPLIAPTIELDRHLFWSNFRVWGNSFAKEKPIAYQTGTNGRFGFNLKGIDVGGEDKRQILRNLVNPEVALHILNSINNQELKLF